MSKITLRFPVVFSRDSMLGDQLLIDPSRAWIDPGFPMSDTDEPLPMDEWPTAPPETLRYQYLKVPFAHPADGWADNPQDDCSARVYCQHTPGDRLRIKSLGVCTVERVAPEREGDQWYWRVDMRGN